MNLHQIHLDHALPALADLGLEALAPLLSGQGLTGEAIAAALQGLARGAEKQAIRRLVAIARATPEQLLAWESSPEARGEALQAAARADLAESQESLTDFFTSLGRYLASIRGSLAAPTSPSEAPSAIVPEPSPAP